MQKSKQLTWLLLLCIYNSPLFQSSKQSCWKRHFLTNLIFTDASVCKWYTREKLRIEVNRSQTRMRICIIRKKLPKIVWITVFLQEIWELILSGGIHEVNLMRIIWIFFSNTIMWNSRGKSFRRNLCVVNSRVSNKKCSLYWLITGLIN